MFAVCTAFMSVEETSRENGRFMSPIAVYATKDGALNHLLRHVVEQIIDGDLNDISEAIMDAANFAPEGERWVLEPFFDASDIIDMPVLELLETCDADTLLAVLFAQPESIKLALIHAGFEHEAAIDNTALSEYQLTELAVQP